MARTWIGAGALAWALAGMVAGCGAPTPTAEQRAPDYGPKSVDRMKEMIGIPKKGTIVRKPSGTAAK